MKNLNQRSKILVAIAAVVVVVVVIAVVVFTQLGGEDLLGASVVGVTPSNPTIVVGQTVTLSASTSLSRCSWSSANTAVATVASNNKSAVVTGRAAGQVSIRVKCGVGLSTGSTTVTVNPAPTPTPVPPTPVPPAITVNPNRSKHSTTIGHNEELFLCTSQSTIMSIASANPADAVLLRTTQSISNYITCYVVTGQFDGTATIRAATAAGGTATVNVTVLYALTMIPANPFIGTGQSITLGMAGANSSSTWTIDALGTHAGMSLSPTTGQSVTVNAGAAPNPVCADVTSTNPTYGTGITRVCIR